jgi:dihydroxyacetone kinase-like protein
MSSSVLSPQETQAMFACVSAEMIRSKDRLTQADKAIGDGDHGVGMARGFEAVGIKLREQPCETLDGLFNTIGMTLLMSIGGAAGAVFGTFFRGGARNLKGREIFDSSALSILLHDGLGAVQARGGAEPGDKTMVDALAPAAAVAGTLTSAHLYQSLPAVTAAARQGMEDTKHMVARIGKAKTLGQRSLGHADPGAISINLILEFMTDYVTEGKDSQ